MWRVLNILTDYSSYNAIFGVKKTRVNSVQLEKLWTLNYLRDKIKCGVFGRE